jgi:hypothetical protein
MPITNITIENFKGIGPRVSIPLRPITLLFGANSAGKSTILQAMLYMRELLERQNADADVLHASGGAINLGGFRQFVHGHDLTKPVRIGVTISIDDDGLPIYPVGRHPEEIQEPRQAELFRSLKSATLTLDVKWDSATEKPWITSYSVELDGIKIGRISAEPGRKSRVKLFPLNAIPDEADDEAEEGEANLDEDSEDYDFIQDFDSDFPIEATADYVVPEFGRALQELTFFSLDSVEIYNEPDFLSILSRIFVGTGELVLNELRSIRYIGPIRRVPERGFNPTRTPAESRWADGSAAWDLLHLETENPPWLSAKQLDNLDIDYRLEYCRYLEIPCGSPLGVAIEKARLGAAVQDLDIDEIPAVEFSKLKPRTRLRILAKDSNVEVAPSDIGVGISQLLPVAIGAMAPGYSVLSVEQPELHIHPAVQCQLADLLAHQAVGPQHERRLLLETHSEHLILRLLRRVREMNEGNLEPGSPEIRPEDLSILYVTSRPEGLEITELPVTEDGDFDKAWPKGFFEERAAELF